MRRLLSGLQFFAENTVWLLGSVLLAVFVWTAATTQQNPIESRSYPERIPIQIVTDEGMIVTNNPISSAQVVLRTTANVWESLTPEDIQITADLTGRPPGIHTVDLNIGFNSLERIVVEEFQPRQIAVAIDPAAEKLVPIITEIRTQPPTGFEVGEITLGVPEVLVSGTASRVEQVANATVRLNLGTERNTFSRNYRLFAVDEQGQTVTDVNLAPDTVDVSIEIQPGEDFREVFVVPNIIGEPAHGYVIYAITYDPQTILVSGRPSNLEQLPGTVQTTAIDLTGQTQSFTRTVPVELPPGVFLPTEQNVTVTVQIDTLTASRRFDHLPVQIQGLSAELEATIAPTEVSILITGAQPILDTLTPGDISIIAPLGDLSTGNHQVALQAVINREGLENAVTSVLPPVLDVTITEQIAGPRPTATALPLVTPTATDTSDSG